MVPVTAGTNPCKTYKGLEDVSFSLKDLLNSTLRYFLEEPPKKSRA